MSPIAGVDRLDPERAAARAGGGRAAGRRAALVALAATVAHRLRAGSPSWSSTSPGWPTVQETFFSWLCTPRRRSRRSLDGLLAQRQAVPGRRAADPAARHHGRGGPQHDGAGAVPAARDRGRLHRPVPRHPDDPGGVPVLLRRPRRCSSRASPTASSGWAWWRWCCPTAPTSPRCSARASSRSTPPSSARATRSGSPTARRMRYVVLPQAVRRVVPPLLNDFVSLQKDTALVARRRALRGAVHGRGLRQLQLQLHALPGRRGASSWR